MKITDTKSSRPRGRPLSFDRDTVLERAMHLFWRKGYESTTVHDLTAAMGITAPSLYSAFGDKEQLYLEAVERYRSAATEHTGDFLDQHATAREAVQALLIDACRSMTNPDTPTGCMLVNSAATSAVASPRVQEAVAHCRQAAQTDLTARITRGIREGDVPAHVDAAMLARFYVTVLTGVAIQSREGLTCADMQAVIESAMLAWPSVSPGDAQSDSAAMIEQPARVGTA